MLPSDILQKETDQGLKRIEKEAFIGLPIRTVVIPAGVESIGASAFANCASLKIAVIPATVTDMADGVFDGCDHVWIYTPEGSFAEQYALEKGLNLMTY